MEANQVAEGLPLKVQAAEVEEAPTSSSSFRIVERVAGSHLDLRQEGP